MPAPPARERRLGSGCPIVLALLAALLVVGFLALDRSVDWLVERAGERAAAAIPGELAGARRARLVDRLERFAEALAHAAGDRERLTGEFLGRVGAILDDRRMTVAEAESLDAWLAEALGEPVGPERSP